MGDRPGESTTRSLEEILLDKGFEADRRIAGLRLVAITLGMILFAQMDRAQAIPWLAWSLIALAWPYGLWMFFAQPFRKWPAISRGQAFLASDALFIVLWLHATGGIASPFLPMLYLAVFAVGFRYPPRVAMAGTILYGVAYVGLIAARREADGNGVRIAACVGFQALAALLGALASRQVVDQAVATHEALEAAQAAEAEAVHAERRASFLSEASKALASSLDYETTLKNVAALVLPTLADNCVVDVLDEDGALHRVAEAALSEENEETLRALRRFPIGADGSPVREAMRSSMPVILPELGEAQLQKIAQERGPDYVRLVRRIGARWSVTVPLIVHGRALGAMTFGRSGTGAPYDREDTRLAEELALRAALAIEHARLFRDAQDAVKTRDEFLSIASHELRTPLNVMQLQTDGLLRQAKKEGDERLLAPLERSRRQVHRLASLVESLLDVSRVTAGRLALEIAEVDLGAIAGEVVARMQDEAVRAGSSIAFEARVRAVGRWDRLRLDQIATNLLSNAIKYGRARPIVVVVDVTGDRARLAVTDHGIGISEADQARIFERFERAVSVRHYGGFGLGLWIVRQIVEAHGGSIAIESRVGEGSTFRVELPIAGPPPPPSATS